MLLAPHKLTLLIPLKVHYYLEIFPDTVVWKYQLSSSSSLLSIFFSRFQIPLTVLHWQKEKEQGKQPFFPGLCILVILIFPFSSTILHNSVTTASILALCDTHSCTHAHTHALGTDTISLIIFVFRIGVAKAI